MSQPVKRPLMWFVGFTIVAYGLSWLCWLPVLDRIKPGLAGMEPQSIALFLLGGAGPSLAAILLSLMQGGPARARGLLAKIGYWRVRPTIYLVAVLFAPTVALCGVGIYAALGNDTGQIRWDHWWVIAAYYGVAIFLGPLLEETGWRGFAQPLVFQRAGIFVTGLMIGTIWTFWHAPLWFAAEGSSLSGGDFSLAGLAAYWLFLTGQSILVAALLIRARGSVLIAMLVHQGVNASAIGWLFYDIVESDKSLVFEQLPVIAIWALVALAAMAGGLKKP